jgi:ATP-dependent DNA ligase
MIYTNFLKEPLDGEIYLHNKDLGDMISIYKNGDVDQVLKYIIYDIPVTNLSFEQRRNLMMSIDVELFNNIEIDLGVEIINETELKEFYNKTLNDGYEGVIVCDPNSNYTPGYRSNSKLKIKPRDTKEFKCINHYWNKGKMSKQSTLICITDDGREFHVKMKGTSEQREKYALEFDEKFRDKMVTVEYRKLSKYGVPIEGVGICVRDYE